jgi:hypothetical protein
VNNSGITFQGYDYDAGQVYCNYIQPAEPYQTTAPYVKIHYDFEIRTPNSSNLTALQIRHPFQLRILDQGLRGVYNDPDLGDTLGHFYLGDGHPVTRDVLLDGTGVPMDDGIKVTAGGLAAVTQTLPDSVLVDTTDNATFLIYMRYAETDFTGIT